MIENDTSDVLEDVQAVSSVDGSSSSSVPPADSSEVYTGVVVEERPILTTGFSDYSVTEGLLFCVLLVLLLDFFLNLLRRWF